MKPGVYDISEEDYHADPCPEPSLSASICKVMWQESCLHAWMKHPKLNPDFEPENRKEWDLGSAAHAVLLERNWSKIEVIDADDWRKKVTQEARDEAYKNGLIPTLNKHMADIDEMVKVVESFIAETELVGIFNNGKPEQTLIARHEGAWLRSRLDWLTTERAIILDYKTRPKGSAHPEVWIRTTLFKMDFDIQAYMYQLLNHLTGGPEDAKFIFLVQQATKPYACSLVGAGPSVIDSGKRKFQTCLHKWKWCLEHNKWPGHETRICWAETPAWQLQEIEERGE